jgi:hypothetical protein
MKYFLSVQTKEDQYLYKDQPYESLNEALSFVSEHYLIDSDIPFRWSGYFAMRNGEITWLKIKSPAAGFYLRKDIRQIDILSARGRLERDTYKHPG